MNAPENNSAPYTVPRQWRIAFWLMIAVGATGALVAAASDMRQLAFSWLVCFMFFLSLMLGALFLVLMHHLFDASWSVPIRRVLEHIACFSFPRLAILFVPVCSFVSYTHPQQDHLGAFGVLSMFCLAVWAGLSWRLRALSIAQDFSGEAQLTIQMRRWSAGGIVLYAITVTIASTLWLENASGPWHSSVFGIGYFASSVWMALPAVWVAAALLRKTNPLRKVVGDNQLYSLGTLCLAFTVFYAYIAYCDYLIVWNGNIPVETWRYAARQQGGWKLFGILLLIGHFAVPFLLLLRTDWKLKFAVMAPLCAWVWLMHYCDLKFQLGPVVHASGPGGWLADVSCFLFFGGFLAQNVCRAFCAHAPYPIRDPRLAESLGIHQPPTTDIATAPLRAK